MKNKKRNRPESSIKKQTAEKKAAKTGKVDKRTLFVRILAGIIAFLMIASVMFSVVGS